MIRLHRELRRLHTDRGGQIMPAFMLGAMALVMLVVWTLNTGHHITRKIEVQNSADAAVMTQANWTARSLNVMAMNNTAMSQSLAVSVTAIALAAAALEAEVTAGIILSYSIPTAISACAACAVPPFLSCFLCASATASSVNAGLAEGFAISAHINMLDIAEGVDYFNLARGFSQMNDHLADSFPEFSHQVGHALALANEIDDPIYFPRVDTQAGNPSTGLPVAIDPLSESGIEFCGSGETGTLGVTILENYYHHGGEYENLSNSGGPFQISRDYLSDRTTTAFDTLGFIWHTVAATFPIPYHSNTRLYPRFMGGQYDQNADDNLFLDSSNIGWGLICGASAISALPFNLYKVDERALLTNALLPPTEAMRDALSIVAFTRRAGQNAPVVGDRFLRGLEDTYGLAQAEVYNVSQQISTAWGEQPTNYDLYTQGWRARIVPATLLAKKRSEIAQAVSQYPKLADLFNALDDADMGILNVH